MTSIFTFIRAWGMCRFVHCILCKFFYRVLRLVYGFHPWHASAPYPCREYKRRIVALADAFAPFAVADIGCGLGEVVARIAASKRYGVDPSAAAVQAARRLYGRRATFVTASLADAAAIREAIPEKWLDLVILANWTHGCQIETLRAQIMSLHAVLPIRAILMDTVRVGGMSVPFLSHTLKDLQTIGEVVKTVEGGDGARDLHIIALPEYEGLA